MGAVGGTIWHGVKGFRNSPYGERRMGAITAIKMRAPVLGGKISKVITGQFRILLNTAFRKLWSLGWSLLNI